MKQFYVYILASASGVMYVGFTNDLERRVHEHKLKLVPGFSAQYNVDRLVHYEVFERAIDGITREKQLKGWSRAKKRDLVSQHNVRWHDLSEDWDDTINVTGTMSHADAPAPTTARHPEPMTTRHPEPARDLGVKEAVSDTEILRSPEAPSG